MPTRNLRRLFSPKRVVVIGASQRVGSVGNTVVRNLLGAGYGGEIIAINRHYDQVEGVRCVGSIADVEGPIDLAVICTPAESTPELVYQCGHANVRGVVILAAGFRETGAPGRELELKLLAAAKRFPTMRIIGPNSLGIISTHVGLNASFADTCPRPGRIALLSQSGALGTAILDWAEKEGVGFSHFVSLGNLIDVTIADLIDFLAEDPHTDSIVMYIESIPHARSFMSAARAFARQKPILAYKSGRFAPTAQAAALHTGAMVGVDAVYDAAFARAGIVRVEEFDDLIHCAELLAHRKSPKGSRLAVISNAGAAGVMTADAVLQNKCKLATFSKQTTDRLAAAERHHAHIETPEDSPVDGPTSMPVGSVNSENHAQPLSDDPRISNPVDLFGDATPERYAEAITTVLADDDVDAAIAVLTPQALTAPTETADALIAAARRSSKPVLAVWMGGQRIQDGAARLAQAGIPVYDTPAKAVRAFSYLVRYSRNREVLQETPRTMPIEFHRDRASLRESFASLMLSDSELLSESNSKALLEAYGIATTRPIVAITVDEAVRYAEQVGFPVAVKVYSPDIVHKTEVGGVILNVSNQTGVQNAFKTIRERCQTIRPDAEFRGVTVQPMVVDPDGRELLIGVRRDPVFGDVMLVGAGGVDAELLQDRSLELPPLNERLARRMLERLQCWPMLGAYRGKPAVDLDQLISVLLRVSYLIADHPEIVELDVNPLLVTPERTIALDANIVIDMEMPTSTDARSRPGEFSHLAIRPYPDEYVRRCRLTDGTQFILRPIMPEDEPLWRQMLATCSEESIRMRFRYLLQSSNHDLAARFCFTDYERELAIVAETHQDGKTEIAGVGRLVADADHDQAEFAVMIADPWQGRGLGSVLTDECLSICDGWGISTVTAEVDPRNHRMLQMFSHRGFIRDSSNEDDILVSKKL
ncbi:bifunctional acetate--CoA ligase family protein/GNAT family N-acetyltransferase [Aporhodopirellula aestuarii]|uniref:Bifunctional acetate--CoA ligase family protein/GNAT family N-acetyltransferase n=1 Tax=Aporhodopirellula aestuarii TaxID=2950107 RepID=A0ABT0U4Y9_9BACT|nr:bifunctional acetate--CoA ligase family protein/GNAT family N-acetyltransferase [Aporhodopirellula aestuarii]MCM2371982.1 bifunctional acetate--CoA ligase family protein/GNAT family N-acetyltransferase [Aporhodopirellula aestuarii]